MNLTDANTLLFKKDFETALNKYGSASRKIASGSNFEGIPSDLGGLSASINLSSGKQMLDAEKVNLQNFLNFLQSQHSALRQVDEMYQRMEVLAFSSLDVILSDNDQSLSSDKALLNKEFEEISAALDDLVNLEVSGRRLFGGVRSDFTDGLQDRNDFSPTNLPQVLSLIHI